MEQLKINIFNKSRIEYNALITSHLLKKSIWPSVIALSLLGIMLSVVLWIQRSNFNNVTEIILLLCFFLSQWWKDVIEESGEHTETIKNNIKIGMVLFITSEVMFFFAFFWSYIHLSGNAAIELGISWPPVTMEKIIMDPFGIPLLNTIILLGSGMLTTLVHINTTTMLLAENVVQRLKTMKQKIKQIKNYQEIVIKFIEEKEKYKEKSLKSKKIFTLTIVLALLFTGLQIYEYMIAEFNISDSCFGSLFYIMTGFHGFHVIVGTIFLTVNLIRETYLIIRTTESVGLEGAIWYWHFVDVVWLFLYTLIYWWTFFKITANISTDYIDYKEIELFEDAITNPYYDDNFTTTYNFETKTIESTDTVCAIIGIGKWGKFGFMEPSSTTMQDLVILHNYIVIYIVVVSIIVMTLLLRMIIEEIIYRMVSKERIKELVKTKLQEYEDNTLSYIFTLDFFAGITLDRKKKEDEDENKK